MPILYALHFSVFLPIHNVSTVIQCFTEMTIKLVTLETPKEKGLFQRWKMSTSANGVGADKDLPDFSVIWYFNNFLNIQSLNYNFHLFENRHCSSIPHLLFLVEAQVFESSKSKPFNASSNCL